MNPATTVPVALKYTGTRRTGYEDAKLPLRTKAITKETFLKSIRTLNAQQRKADIRSQKANQLRLAKEAAAEKAAAIAEAAAEMAREARRIAKQQERNEKRKAQRAAAKAPVSAIATYNYSFDVIYNSDKKQKVHTITRQKSINYNPKETDAVKAVEDWIQ
jgi:hypothetical protein